jgi:hypothetical protein
MKHIKRLTFFLTLSFLSTSAFAQVSNADSMIHRLFNSLKNKDEKSFVTLYPNTQQMNKMVRGMMETMFKSEEMQKMMAMDEKAKNMNIDSLIDVQMAQMNKPETQAEMQKSYGESFRSIIEKGEKKGVNWSQAQLVSYTIDTTAKADDQEMRMFAGSGIKAMSGIIDFKAGGTDYQMNYEKVLYIPSERGWFGGEFKQVIKKGESFAKEGEIKEMEESPRTTTPTESKTKVKTDGNKTKVKTKTPAAKTKTKTKAKA